MVGRGGKLWAVSLCRIAGAKERKSCEIFSFRCLVNPREFLSSFPFNFPGSPQIIALAYHSIILHAHSLTPAFSTVSLFLWVCIVGGGDENFYTTIIQYKLLLLCYTAFIIFVHTFPTWEDVWKRWGR